MRWICGTLSITVGPKDRGVHLSILSGLSFARLLPQWLPFLTTLILLGPPWTAGGKRTRWITSTRFGSGVRHVVVPFLFSGERAPKLLMTFLPKTLNGYGPSILPR